jgi:hypothetical protein
MSAVRREFLQWVGLVAGPCAWMVQLAGGYTVTQASCSAGGSPTIARVPIEIGLTAAAAAVAIVAEAAAFLVYRDLQRVTTNGVAPPGRQRFFAVGGLAGNALFLVAILLGGIGVLAQTACGA